MDSKHLVLNLFTDICRLHHMSRLMNMNDHCSYKKNVRWNDRTGLLRTRGIMTACFCINSTI